MRQGPGAATRAWCVYELVKTLAKKCKLYVVLSRADVDGFRNLLFSALTRLRRSLPASTRVTRKSRRLTIGRTSLARWRSSTAGLVR